MRVVRQSLVFLLLLQLCLLGSCGAALNNNDNEAQQVEPSERNQLRIKDDSMMAEEEEPSNPNPSLLQRFLQFGFDDGAPDLKSTVLKSLVSYFTPTMTKTLRDTLQKDFDPLILGGSNQESSSQQQQQRQDLSHEEITSMLQGTSKRVDCNTSTGEIVYYMKELRGLGSVELADDIYMVPEDNNISVSLLQGATWNVTWVLNATFTKLTAAANASLHVDFDECGEGTAPIDQSLDGTTVLQHPSILLTIYIQGETSNLILFQSTSRVTNADILDLEFHYDSLQVDLGRFGGADNSIISSRVDMGAKLGEMLERDVGEFELVMKEALQVAIDEGLPFTPDSL